MSAILFGSISTIADTSELQRESFNQAFEQHGLGWYWGREEYISMLPKNGGEERVREFAASKGEVVDAASVHRSKSAIFQDLLAEREIEPRPGVVETIHSAKDNGFKVALVTTTSHANITALAAALTSKLPFTSFDVIVDSSDEQKPKPDKASFNYALDQLGEAAADCVAIEDNVGGVQAAVAAGLTCVAFPNQNTAHHAFDESSQTVEVLDFHQLHQIVSHDGHQS